MNQILHCRLGHVMQLLSSAAQLSINCMPFEPALGSYLEMVPRAQDDTARGSHTHMFPSPEEALDVFTEKHCHKPEVPTETIEICETGCPFRGVYQWLFMTAQST